MDTWEMEIVLAPRPWSDEYVAWLCAVAATTGAEDWTPNRIRRRLELQEDIKAVRIKPWLARWIGWAPNLIDEWYARYLELSGE